MTISERDGLRSADLAPHSQGRDRAGQQDEGELAGHTEQQLSGNLEQQQPHGGPLCGRHGLTGLAARGRRPPACPQRLLRTRELQDAFGQRAVRATIGGVGGPDDPLAGQQRAQ